MSLCPRCKHRYTAQLGKTGDNPCPRCGLSPWDVLLNGRQHEWDEEEEEATRTCPTCHGDGARLDCEDDKEELHADA